MDWKDCISYIQTVEEKSEDFFVKLVWQRLQLGDRSQDLQQTIVAMKSLQDAKVTQNPEWKAAMKWLAYERSIRSSIMLDMIWKQLETGDRTPELLEVIRREANSPTIQPKESDQLDDVRQNQTEIPSSVPSSNF